MSKLFNYLSIILALFLFFIFYLDIRYEDLPLQASLISTEFFGERAKIILTFDDGPTPITTIQILDVLDIYNQKAIFFVRGDRLQKYPELGKEIINRGHILGYHSMEHRDLGKFSKDYIKSDIENFKKLVKEMVDPNYEVIIGRPPFGGFIQKTGKINKKIIQSFRENNLKILMWTIDIEDWKKPVDVEDLIKKITKGGEQIVLFHEEPVDAGSGKIYHSDAYLKLEKILAKLLEKNLISID